MLERKTEEPTLQKPLRLWPGVDAAVLLCVVRFGLPVVKPEETGSAILGGLIGARRWSRPFYSRAACGRFSVPTVLPAITLRS